MHQLNNKSKVSLGAERYQERGAGNFSSHIVDNRPESIMQRKKGWIDNRPQTNPFAPIQKKSNNTGLPDKLKSGIEHLSGYSMDDVKVHYNSNQPAQLQAHAYAQGTNIHLGPGQEKHLPHEAWHVVQQKQGRVKPTMQMKGKVNVNDDVGLEREADVMGAKALQNFANQSDYIIQSKQQEVYNRESNFSFKKETTPVQRVLSNAKGVEYKTSKTALTQVLRRLRRLGDIDHYLLRSKIEILVGQIYHDPSIDITITKLVKDLKPIIDAWLKKMGRRRKSGRNVSRLLRRKARLRRGNVTGDLQKDTGKDAYVATAKNFFQAPVSDPFNYSQACASAIHQNEAGVCDQFGNAAALLLAQKGKKVAVRQNTTTTHHTWATIDPGKTTEVQVDPWTGEVGSANEMTELPSESYRQDKTKDFPFPMLTPEQRSADPFGAKLPAIPDGFEAEKEKEYEALKKSNFESSNFYQQGSVKFGSEVSEDELESESDSEDVDTLLDNLPTAL